MHEPTSMADVEFSAIPASVGEARRSVVAACDGLDRKIVDTATLLTSEIVTNAVQHAGGLITMGIDRGQDSVMVGVRDGSLSLPARGEQDTFDQNGRGLRLVSQLASSWGCMLLPDGAGKIVWFALSG